MRWVRCRHRRGDGLFARYYASLMNDKRPLETGPSFLDTWPRVWSRHRARPRSPRILLLLLLLHVGQLVIIFVIIVSVVDAISPDGPHVRLVFVVELFLGSRHTSWCHSPQETTESAVGFVDSLVLALACARRCPVHGCVCLFVDHGIFALSMRVGFLDDTQTVHAEACSGAWEAGRVAAGESW